MADDEASSQQDPEANQQQQDAPPPADEALVKMHEIVDIFLARPDSGPFREPVDWRGMELFDYPEIVKFPMDLGTVKRKLERNEYDCAAAAAYDIKLIWKNCQKYNAEGSEFWILAKSYLRRFEDLYRKVRYEHDVGEMPVSPVASGEEDEDDDEEMADDDSLEEDDDDQMDDDSEEDEDRDDARKATSGSNAPAKKGRRVKQKVEPKKLDARAQLATNIHLLDGTHLGIVIAMLQKECPAALEYIHGQAEEEQVEIMLEKLENTETFQKVSEFCAEHAVKRRGVPLIEEAMRRMTTDPEELLPSEHVEDPSESAKGTKRGRPRTDNRDIQQIDAKTGDVVNVFASLSAAGNAVGFSRHIVASILRKKYKAKSYQGWTFKYVGGEPDGYGEDLTGKSKSKKKKKSKQASRSSLASPRAIAVAELDAATGKTLRVHPSLTKASKGSGANRHVITKVLSGEIPSWQGLQWRYCDAESGVPIEMSATDKEEKEES